MSTRLETRYLDAKDYEAWDDVVAESIGGSAYSSSGYLDAICNAAGGDFRLLAVIDKSQIVGGIGLYIRARNQQPYVRGRYFLYYNGPFVRPVTGASPMAQEENVLGVLEGLERELRQSSYHPIDIKVCPAISDCRPFLQYGWCAKPSYSYEVDITDRDECFSRMHRNVRRQIRQAERAGVVVESNSDVETFYEMHQATCRRKGFPTYLERDQMVEFLGGLLRRDLARLYMAGEPDSIASAGIFVLTGSHPVTHAVCAASANGKLPPGANAWLRWQAFQDLSKDGYKAIDLTDAHEPSVAKFKRQLGARLVVSQQLSLPMTARDHLSAAHEIAKRNAKAQIKSILKHRDAG